MSVLVFLRDVYIPFFSFFPKQCQQCIFLDSLGNKFQEENRLNPPFYILRLPKIPFFMIHYKEEVN